MVSSEKRKKFLIGTPLMWYGKFILHQAIKINVYETSLLEEDGKTHYVRSIVKECNNRCGITYSYVISDILNTEWETDLNFKEYNLKLKKLDSNKNKICKSKYQFNFHNNMFDLDLFKENLLGLSILEIKNTTDKILLPPHFKLIKEITDDLHYSRKNLFNLKFYGNYSRLDKEIFPRRCD